MDDVPAPGPLPTVAPPPVRVLVVDDQPPFRRAARTVIGRTAGFLHVGDAATGEEAVEVVGELRPDLVLMDIRLPGIDGIEATRRVLAARPSVVVFLCSTLAADGLPEGAASCGARAYVHKEELGPALLRRLWDDPAAARA